MHRRSFVVILSVTCAAGLASVAEARCAPLSVPAEVQGSAYVVEAVLEQAGATGHFRTVTVWKGGAQAPARFTLSARRGRGQWPWQVGRRVGHRFLLFLVPVEGGGFRVGRCGSSGEARDRIRALLRAQGLRPTER